MSDNVVYLAKPPSRIAEFVRVGYDRHVQCEHLISAGKIEGNRFVFDACNLDRHGALVADLLASGSEVVLDTNAAELSAPGRFSRSARHAPWAADGRALEPEDFRPGTNRSVIEPIARCVADLGFTSVLAPSHHLGHQPEDHLELDLRSADALSEALARAVTGEVRVDYPLILRMADLKNSNTRRRIIAKLRLAAFDQLWIRLDGFGDHATGAAISKAIAALEDFKVLGRPIIIDHASGLPALALEAFGVASGHAHGIGGKNRFAASDWFRPAEVRRNVFICQLSIFNWIPKPSGSYLAPPLRQGLTWAAMIEPVVDPFS